MWNITQVFEVIIVYVGTEAFKKMSISKRNKHDLKVIYVEELVSVVKNLMLSFAPFSL